MELSTLGFPQHLPVLFRGQAESVAVGGGGAWLLEAGFRSALSEYSSQLEFLKGPSPTKPSPPPGRQLSHDNFLVSKHIYNTHTHIHARAHTP